MVNGGADQETPRKLAGSIEIMFWFIQKLSEKKKKVVCGLGRKWVGFWLSIDVMGVKGFQPLSLY